MKNLIPYNEHFGKVVDIIESAKERAYRKVNEELILMYRDIGEYISVHSETAEYGDAFVQKLADFFSSNYPDLKGFNRRGLYRMKQFYENVPKTRLVRRMPVAIRIDGKAFHTFTKGFQKPFDEVLHHQSQPLLKAKYPFLKLHRRARYKYRQDKIPDQALCA